MRTHSTLQLIFRHWYAGVTMPEAEAVEELNRRGWNRLLRLVALAAIVPFILPERIIVEVDMGDPWEEADWPTIGASILFSCWMVSPVVFLVSGIFAAAKWFDGNPPNWWIPITAGAIFAIGSLWVTVRIWQAKKKHEA